MTALFVVRRRGCVPRTSFHPKIYVFHGSQRVRSVVGSGNLSLTGLTMGVEAAASTSSAQGRGMNAVASWYRSLWREATPLGEVLDRYLTEYRNYENRRTPVPRADDVVPASAGTRGQLTAAELRRLRVCEHLWVEAGNLHLNRGPGRPGNQLMLKRNTRSYFGFEVSDLEPDTTIGAVAIEYAGTMRPDCSLRFSNNSMDVLTLPVPGAGGPSQYDREVLLFRRIGVRRFVLRIARQRDVERWRRESDRVDGQFQMASGRRWGVF